MKSYRSILVGLFLIFLALPTQIRANPACLNFISPESGAVITTNSITFQIPYECTNWGFDHTLIIRNAEGDIILEGSTEFYVGRLNGEQILTHTVSNINLPNGEYQWNIKRYWGRWVHSASGWRPFTLSIPSQWFRDADGDGYGDSENYVWEGSQPEGYVDNSIDCNDDEASAHPNATELCGDGVDNDCDGEELDCGPDADGDGWRADAGDCDDTNPDIHPRASEKCNDGVDQNCFGGDLPCAETRCSRISDTPIISGFAPPPNLMILWDNSGSMDWSFATNEDYGIYQDYYYVFEGNRDAYPNTFIPWGAARNTWKGRCASYNRLYYDPTVTYEPWPDTDQYQNLRAFKDHTASDPRLARVHPIHYGRQTLNLNAFYINRQNAGVDIRNAHYFYRWGSYIYLVQMYDGRITYHRGPSYVDWLQSRSYNRFTRRYETHRMRSVTANQVPQAIRSRTYAQERQNFANWFTFHRKRHYAAVNSISQMLTQVTNIRVGIRGINFYAGGAFPDTINYNLNIGIRPINVDGENQVNTLLNSLYRLKIAQRGTDLRRALMGLGNYIDDRHPGSVFYGEEAGGACQHAFALIVTDGHWSNSRGPFRAVGDRDGDRFPNTLADVAMKYYAEDLSPRLPNRLPITATNRHSHQHMSTYAITFNTTGRINRHRYRNCPGGCTSLYPARPHCNACPWWPEVTNDSSSQHKTDDLWHATVNTRGELYSVNNPHTLSRAFQSAAASIDRRIRSSSALTVNSGSLTLGTTLYQASYSTDGWVGDIKAWGVDATTGDVNTTPQWSAADVLRTNLAEAGWWSSGNGRKIFTALNGQGVTFTSDRARAMGMYTDLVNYIRGDTRREGTLGYQFRQRRKPLGDIVNSSPHFANGTIFAGANDGMLHAFDAVTGREKFAYIPSFVRPNLRYLASQNYAHNYFVDQSPVSKTLGQTTYLVGGLGKGGKGYYCLDISTSKLNPTSESIAASTLFKWEFPRTTDDDMGYSFSQPQIVNTRAGWAVIFGNGYESTNEKAVLYVVNLLDGTLIKKIDTQTGDSTQCNGLSSPTAIDMDLDGIVDYVYAGDLLGNMWKFDLSNTDSSQWHIPFSDSANAPQPLVSARNKNGHIQPITSKPTVLKHCDKDKDGYLIIFGTGILLGKKDAVNASPSTLYGIWDWADEWKKVGRTTQERSVRDKYLGTINLLTNGDRGFSNLASRSYLPATARNATLVEQTEVHSETEGVRVLSNNLVKWYDRDHPTSVSEHHIGWCFDLPETRERILHNVLPRSGTAIVVSTIPVTHPCDQTSRSYLMEINPCTGGRTSSIFIDINNDGKLNKRDTVLVDYPGQEGKRIWVAATGIRFEGSLSLPTILTLEENIRERKYFSHSDGTINTVDEAPEELGMFYWRETEQ